MVATQKITSLAFGLADGRLGNKENQSDLRRKHLLKYLIVFSILSLYWLI